MLIVTASRPAQAEFQQPPGNRYYRQTVGRLGLPGHEVVQQA